MTKTRTPKEPKPLTARGATENVTGVYRIPATVKAAIEKEAASDKQHGLPSNTPAGFVRMCVAKELERRDYRLALETRLACHVE